MQFRKLRKIINTYDLLDLLAIGTPKDEYSPEIKSILKRLKKGQTQKEVKGIVNEEFIYWFDEDLIKDKSVLLNKIARDISKEN